MSTRSSTCRSGSALTIGWPDRPGWPGCSSPSTAWDAGTPPTRSRPRTPGRPRWPSDGLEFVLAPVASRSGRFTAPLAGHAVSCTPWRDGVVAGTGPIEDPGLARSNAAALARLHAARLDRPIPDLAAPGRAGPRRHPGRPGRHPWSDRALRRTRPRRGPATPARHRRLDRRLPPAGGPGPVAALGSDPRRAAHREPAHHHRRELSSWTGRRWPERPASGTCDHWSTPAMPTWWLRTGP